MKFEDIVYGAIGFCFIAALIGIIAYNAIN